MKEFVKVILFRTNEDLPTKCKIEMIGNAMLRTDAIRYFGDHPSMDLPHEMQFVRDQDGGTYLIDKPNAASLQGRQTIGANI